MFQKRIILREYTASKGTLSNDEEDALKDPSIFTRKDVFDNLYFRDVKDREESIRLMSNLLLMIPGAYQGKKAGVMHSLAVIFATDE